MNANSRRPFSIYTDDKENGTTTANKAGQAQKRSAFSDVSNNLRVQPGRAAKNNAPSRFGQQVESKRARVPFGSAQEQSATPNENVEDSPMVLDVSVMDTHEEIPTPSGQIKDRDLTLYCIPEYQDDMHQYLRDAEIKNRPKPHYMNKQRDISLQMRTILVDWLVEVGEEYKLHDETLHLAVNYIDRFLSQMSVMRNKLQLVGTACMYIASKYEEIYPPDVGEFVYITDDTYTKRQLLRMEHLVAKVLNFELCAPTSQVFADYYHHRMGGDEILINTTKYLMELSLLRSDRYLKYKPSEIAAAASYAAYLVLSKPIPDNFNEITRYNPELDLSFLSDKLLDSARQMETSDSQRAVHEKYSTDKHRAVTQYFSIEPTEDSEPERICENNNM